MLKNIASSLADHAPSEKGLKEKWNACLESVKEDISPQGFRTWLSPIIPVSFVEEKLILRVPSQFFFEWIETHYQKILLKAVKGIFGFRSQIEYLVASTPDNKPQSIHLPHDSLESLDGKSKTESHNVDTRYQFDDFFVKNDNELALRAAQTVAKNPGKTDFNPLFIYGEDGCGKTHLLNAVGSFTLRNKDRKKVIYLSSEHFLNQYIYALQHKKLDLFKTKYENTDILLLDDIQFLSHKKKSQEGLFFFFSELERKRKQIVITANQPPAQLVGLDQRLISFFQKGLIVDLIAPSYETRLKYIKFFCEKSGLTILPEVREFLARSLTEGMQQLRAVMVRISAQSSLLGKPMTLNATKRLLAQIDLNWAKRNSNFPQLQRIKIEEILKTVSEYLNMPTDMITGYSRQREVSFARQVAIYLAKELSGEPLRVIGYHFKDRHYTSILHNYKKIKSEMKSNPAIHNLISELKIKLIRT
jgi:chromosomal replication initiator protein